MRTISVTRARRELTSLIKKVNATRESVIITKHRKPVAVLHPEDK
ncbi:type II toxin-antitoxin system Phd/YefM family antitoxin [Ectopseudomonas khazarica]